MKKVTAVILCLITITLYANALAEPAVDQTALATQVVIWILCGVLTALSALVTWVARTYVVPWLKAAVVPWLTQHNLLDAAKVAGEYAEAMLGRFNGEEKLKLALEVLKNRGWNIDSDEVLQAVKAKWQELDLAQVAAGVKEITATTTDI